jgi:hypothetical protein
MCDTHPCRAIKQEEIPEVKKAKTEIAISGFTEEESKLYTEQNKILFQFRDQLQKNLSKNELVVLLQTNNQVVPVGIDRVSFSLFICDKFSRSFSRFWTNWLTP